MEILFKENFEALCRLSVGYIADLEASKDIVHEVFIRFWHQYESLPAESNYRSYLFKAVRNKSLNFLRDQKSTTGSEVLEHMPAGGTNPAEQAELEKEIRLGLAMLPEKCLEIFELSRFEGLKYSEIAERLDISIKTVEAQMSKALKLLREYLREFLILLVIILLN